MRFLIKILRNIETHNISDNAAAHAIVATTGMVSFRDKLPV